MSVNGHWPFIFRVSGWAPPGEDLYSRLLRALSDSGKIQEAVFGSLNYDCLLEQAAYGLGLHVDYSCDEIASSSIRVAKIHGSCNFITEPLSQHGKAMLAGAGVHYEVQVKFHRPVDLEQTLKEKLSGRDDPTHFPVMSQISPHKEHFVSPARIQAIRNRWSENVFSASIVVIIGVSHNPNDTRVLEAIQRTRAQIFYVGDKENFDQWHNMNTRVEHIGERFADAFDDLLRKLVG